MKTPPNVLELFESSVLGSLFMFLFVCFVVVVFFLLSVLFFCFLFTNRKEEEWQMVTRGEV